MDSLVSTGWNNAILPRLETSVLEGTGFQPTGNLLEVLGCQLVGNLLNPGSPVSICSKPEILDHIDCVRRIVFGTISQSRHCVLRLAQSVNKDIVFCVSFVKIGCPNNIFEYIGSFLSKLIV